MADEAHLKILRQGSDAWSVWRQKKPELIPDLSMTDLLEADLRQMNLSKANFSKTNFYRANLMLANLRGACLDVANLILADLRGADLSEADPRGAQLIGTDLRDTTLSGSDVHGVSVWDIKVDDRTKQQNLNIIAGEGPAISVDNIKVAQFIYLLLNNQEIRDVIDTITSQAVLILGRFSEERKPVLDAIRNELRKPERNYLPIVFDFQPSTNQTTIETIRTLEGV